MSNREQFITKAAKECGLTKAVIRQALDGIEGAIYQSLRDGDEVVLFTGFRLEPKVIPARAYYSRLYDYSGVSEARLGCRLHTTTYFKNKLNQKDTEE